jgi:hypothetical protein
VVTEHFAGYLLFIGTKGEWEEDPVTLHKNYESFRPVMTIYCVSLNDTEVYSALLSRQLEHE